VAGHPYLTGSDGALVHPQAGRHRALPCLSGRMVPTIMDRMDVAGRQLAPLHRRRILGYLSTFADCYYTPQVKNMVVPETILNDAKNGTLPNFGILLPNGVGGATSQHNSPRWPLATTGSAR